LVNAPFDLQKRKYYLPPLLAVIAGSAFTVGCVSNKGYFGDRLRDAADILTVTAGKAWRSSIYPGKSNPKDRQ
jgi:hypothetical protein